MKNLTFLYWHAFCIIKVQAMGNKTKRRVEFFENRQLAAPVARAGDLNDFVTEVDFSRQLGALLSGNGNDPTTTVFNLGAFTPTWPSGQSMNLSLAYNNGTGHSNTLTMVSSLLTLQSTNAVAPAAIPEPGSVMLVGLGLVGLLFGRAKIKSA